jgi:hypothetical protein
MLYLSIKSYQGFAVQIFYGSFLNFSASSCNVA